MSSFSCNGPEELFVYPQPELMAHNRKNAYIPWWKAYLRGENDIVEVFTGLGIDPEEKCPKCKFKSGLRLKAGHTFLKLAASWEDFLTPSTYRIGQTLIKLGANVDTFDSCKETMTLVQLAIAHSMSLCVQLLLENGAGLTGPEWLGYSPGFLALGYWDVNFADEDDGMLAKINETFRVLFKHGIDPKWRDEKGRNFLNNLILKFSRAENHNYDILEIAKTMVKAGVPVDDLDDNNFTPLHRAVHRNDPKLTDYLLENGANVYLVTDDQSYVELAVIYDADKVLDLFLNKGICQVNDRSCEDGSTLLHLACSYLKEKIRIISLLLRRGADVSLKDNKGKTPFSLLDLDDAEQKDSITYILKEISKAFFVNKKVCEEDWKLISEHKKTFKIFESFKQELEKMSSPRFYGFCTYLKVLKMSKSINKLAKLARNEVFVNEFWANLKLFDYYKEDLEIIFNRAVELRDESLQVYSRIETIFYEFFPDVVLRKMSDHLRIKDLPLTE